MDTNNSQVFSMKPKQENIDVKQFVLNYKHNNQNLICGATLFRCDDSWLVLLTNLPSENISITNSIESAATALYKQKLAHLNPFEMLFIEHYNRKDGQMDFCKIDMSWDSKENRFIKPLFMSFTQFQLQQLLSCYHYHPNDFPALSFKPASVIQFKPRVS